MSGYLWVLYFSRGKELKYFVIVHADGTPLSKALADAVVEMDKGEGGILHSLAYLDPLAATDTQSLKDEAFAQYRHWLGEECGYIQLDGLPADSDLSATKLRLEKLFVPLKAIHKLDVKSVRLDDFWLDLTDVEVVEADGTSEGSVESAMEFKEEDDDVEFSDFDSEPDFITESIGHILARQSHLAILASPGGGKSTLLKRLATAYSFPERRTEVADDLPSMDWLPLYLRCRDLRDRSHRPILELLYGIAAFANMSDDSANCFKSGVSDSLRCGRALLLVDGLDEISDEGARRAFAQNLRTFIAMFPSVALVVTSRVAGFRDVAGVIAGTCHQLTLAPLDYNDVKRLCISWHSEVVADTDRVRGDAANLADLIWENKHIRSLVENPLLLTTLLVVKRSNGEIPPSRVELYSEAVRVLVRTWNVEGYAPLDERETLARLSYVACAMMKRGVQLIGNTALINLLHEAAVEMEPELQFAKVSPSEFIQRIEYRSSLLMQTGYQKLDGELQPVFEFRHLTFQEYLAAKGFVAEQYPGRNEDVPLVEILAPFIEDERWREVIPLASVLAGRKADSIIKRIISEFKALDVDEKDSFRGRSFRVLLLLAKCLLEEVTLSQGVLRDALVEVALRLGRQRPTPVFESLFKGRFGEKLVNTVEEEYYSGGLQWTYFGSPLSEISRFETGRSRQELIDEELAKQLSETVVSGERGQKIKASLLLMQMAFECREDQSKIEQLLVPYGEDYRSGFLEMLRSGDPPSAQSASWAIAWFGLSQVWHQPGSLDMLKELYRLWRHEDAPELVSKAAWAFRAYPLYPRDSISGEFWGDCEEWLKAQWNGGDGNARSAAAILLGWYRRSPWTDDELAVMIQTHYKSRSQQIGNIKEILATLGDAGASVLRKWDDRSTRNV